MEAKDHHHFMGKALRLAEQALNRGEFPVGCVVVDESGVVSGGARVGSRPPDANELDHAEMVALRRLFDRGVALPLRQGAIYCTMEPCLMCYGAILLSGIRKIYFGFEDVMGGGTGGDPAQLAPLYRDSGVRITGGLRRAECHALFRRFFQDPKNGYWRGSLLADYTLAQGV